MLKVHSQASFSREIEKLVQSDNLSYLDAVVHYMQSTGLEPESIPKLLNRALKDKLEEEATDLYLVNRDRNKLKLE